MNFAAYFEKSGKSFWIYPFILTILISVPLHITQASSLIGRITTIDVIERIIEVDGQQYKIAPQIDLKKLSNETEETISITDLKVGYYVEFEADGNLIQSLRVFDVPHI
ncbi:MAG: hypothetical protein H6973_01190 [Gammaproteobacteria bacterium]|nr:hypothetical protein [Gammaproteobacteria bacterium]